MSEASLILTTFPDEETARQIGTLLLKKQLIACLTLLPPARSLYVWDGEIQDDSEIPAFLKTQPDRLAALE
ncbi:MAG: divalent-cation tolerance protein CutA, partial [Verrucomicrobiales bacterium]